MRDLLAARTAPASRPRTRAGAPCGTAFGGQRSPVMCSLDASPVPSAIHSRSREHLAQRRRRLRDDRRVVALPGRVDDAERQRGRAPARRRGRTRRSRTRPGAHAPRREVVGGHAGVEAGLLGVPDGAQQAARRDLLVRAVQGKAGHAPHLPVTSRTKRLRHPRLTAATVSRRDPPRVARRISRRAEGHRRRVRARRPSRPPCTRSSPRTLTGTPRRRARRRDRRHRRERRLRADGLDRRHRRRTGGARRAARAGAHRGGDRGARPARDPAAAGQRRGRPIYERLGFEAEERYRDVLVARPTPPRRPTGCGG